MRALATSLCLMIVITAAPAPRAEAQAPDRFAAPDHAYANKDYATAHRLWLDLATEGNGSAYFNLGRLYLFGEGVTIDLIEAYKWFEMARQAGVPRATVGLTRLAPVMTPSDVAEAERRIERWYADYPAASR